MRVLIFSAGADTGGQGERIRQGFAEHQPDWHVDALALADKYMAYPAQFTGPAHSRVVRARELYDAADVVHLRLTLGAWEKMDRGQGKPVVLHHHGTIFRGNSFAIAQYAQRIGAVQVASTIDLTMLAPGVAWLPAPLDFAPLRALRDSVYKPSDRIRIAHAPTNRNAKHTNVLAAAVKMLAREHPVDLDIIENVTWAQCLARKAQADIFYDQLNYGYGNNAVEAWAMGMPVLSGVGNPNVQRAMIVEWGRIPFVEASAATLADQLRALILSRDMRAEYAAIGAEHVERFHSAARVVAQLADIYRSAPRTVRAHKPTPLPAIERRRQLAGRWC